MIRSALGVGGCPQRVTGKIITINIPNSNFFNRPSLKECFQGFFHRANAGYLYSGEFGRYA